MSAATTHVIDGLPTRVQVRGEGPPLLMIGGVWSQVSLCDDVLPLLDGFTTIAFDPPGIGATTMPQRPYSVRQLAGFAARVLDAVGVERAHVLGVSLGGAVAQELARFFPGRVDRLVLVPPGTALSASPVVPRLCCGSRDRRRTPTCTSSSRTPVASSVADCAQSPAS